MQSDSKKKKKKKIMVCNQTTFNKIKALFATLMN